MARSNKRVWWRCEKGHEWQARVVDRMNGNGCGKCAWKNPPLYRVLVSTMPELVKEWHPTKNGALTPNKILANSPKKVWWQCSKGHEWEAPPMARVRRHGCPFCANRRAVQGETDLKTCYPELAAEWHPTRNGELTPEQVTAGSAKKVWWQCSKGHAWEAKVEHRSNGVGCPICAGKKVLPGYNDLLSRRPEIAKEWHPAKNGVLLPEQVTVYSNKEVWWQCSKGHTWKAKVENRAYGSGCPVCGGRGRKKGYLPVGMAAINEDE